MFTCYFTRRVSVGFGPGARFVKRAELPIPPFPGLEVLLDDGEPEEVDSVMINHAGEVVVSFGDRIYDQKNYEIRGPEQASALMALHTTGWTKLDKGEHLAADSVIGARKGCKPLGDIIETRGPWKATVPVE